ncbi:molecular chaperone Tir [Paraburkholderia sp. NMBU_R16]|uniref:molecular chaperone Tir n=1 Tax=Paraburkholderia sp. NMBU_R16 TaxID=2698676 RepID=UPI001566BA57|nr:molecular chaperone Tir [Paraburkholderia sp. NMBU_R16]NRO98863.1 molecular chaperone Tir [Paraburkholderia sp. NMBU_R16]
MSRDRYVQLIGEVCSVVGLSDPDYIVETGAIEVEGFYIRFDHYEEKDPNGLYLTFHFGSVTAGRTLAVFRLMLEANLLIYAIDQAQMAVDSETGTAVLLVYLTMGEDLTGESLVGICNHYIEHGRYWQNNILQGTDEMFEGIASGNFNWIRA